MNDSNFSIHVLEEAISKFSTPTNTLGGKYNENLVELDLDAPICIIDASQVGDIVICYFKQYFEDVDLDDVVVLDYICSLNTDQIRNCL